MSRIQSFSIQYANSNHAVCPLENSWPWCYHDNDVIMSAMASQITSLTIIHSTVYSCADQRKHQSSASLAFVRGIHQGPVNSPHKWPVTRKMFPFDDIIMTFQSNHWHGNVFISCLDTLIVLTRDIVKTSMLVICFYFQCFPFLVLFNRELIAVLPSDWPKSKCGGSIDIRI